MEAILIHINSVAPLTLLHTSYQAAIPAKAGRPKGGGVSRSERAHPVPLSDPPGSTSVASSVKPGMTIKAKGLLTHSIRRLFTCCFLIILFLSFLSGCDRPKMTGLEPDEIDTSQDPVQMPFKADEPIIVEVKNGYFMITPVAEYKISGVVVSKKTYSSDWDGKVSPVDLAVTWGKLAEPGFSRYITYSQGNRWYFYQYKPGSPFDSSYVISHSSNNHIIPANENIRRAVKTVKKKNKVVLEGYLVNLKGTYKEQPVTWNTSLSRTDAGNGSCELFYVSKVRIDKKVYE
jgi:hypothetical protein